MVEDEQKTAAATMMASWSMEAVMLPASMVLVQTFTIGALLLSKLALNIGIEPFVLLAYRNLIGAIIVAPFAFYFDRYVLTGRMIEAYVAIELYIVKNFKLLSLSIPYSWLGSTSSYNHDL